MKKLVFFFIMICFIVSGLTAQQNNMVRIKGGTFTMGSPSNEVGRVDDEVQRQVIIGAFSMSKYEVTQKEYQEVMGVNPSKFKGENLPVENVTWFNAIEYCNKRSQKEELTPVYTITADTVTVNWNANGYRLPTEAEWEYACRAGTTTEYYFGNDANKLGEYAWYRANSDNKTHEVGKKKPNAFGLYDMHGNVGEWCWDWYGDNATGAQKDWRETVASRDGGWGTVAEGNRSTSRYESYTYSRVDGSNGFRVVRN